MKITGKTQTGHWLAGRLPFYYGWLMAAIAIIAQGVTGVGQTFGISVFNPSLLDTLDISLSALSGAYMVGTLLAAIPQPYIGSLMDRFGIRSVSFGISILLGGACLFFARVNSLPALFLGFFLLRLLGQGGLSLLASNIPAMWFREKLGTVTGIVSSGFSASVAIIPPIFLALVKWLGWRSAMKSLGLLVWAIMLPLIWIIYQDHPEDVGQIMDGQSDLPEKENADHHGEEISFTPRQAQKTASYWIMLVNNALWSLIVTALVFNILSILEKQGVSQGVAAATYSTFAIAALLTQLLLGRIANRGPLQLMLMATMVTLAGAVLILSRADTVFLTQSYAVVIGVSGGLIALVGGTLFPRYYGKQHLGKIRGGVMTAQVAGSSLGPFITGVIYDLSGSFQPALWLFVALLIPAALISLKATPPAVPVIRSN